MRRRRSFDLDGATVLVTGASAGIGAEVVKQLAARGSRLVVHGRDPARTAAVAREVDGVPVVVDLAEPAAAKRLAQQAESAYGSVDAVVLNAGVGWSGAFETMPLSAVSRLLAVDLAAPVELTRLVLPGMLRRGSGSICFVGSVVSRNAVAGEAAYAAAKSGLDTFSQSLALELSGSGVHVGVVLPALVTTDFRHGQPTRRARRWPRPVDPDRVAEAVVRTLSGERSETWLPGWVRASSIVRAVAPGTYQSLNARFGGRPPTGPVHRQGGGR